MPVEKLKNFLGEDRVYRARGSRGKPCLGQRNGQDGDGEAGGSRDGGPSCLAAREFPTLAGDYWRITDKVPLPDLRKAQYHGVWSVFMSMRKGQSFSVPTRRYKQVWSAIKWWSNKYGIIAVFVSP